jgi:hypothetical protein
VLELLSHSGAAPGIWLPNWRCRPIRCKHVQNILMKPGVHSRLEAAARAIRPDPPPLSARRFGGSRRPRSNGPRMCQPTWVGICVDVRLAITRGLIDCAEDRTLRAVLVAMRPSP